jgi:3-deoxy-D-arabino-heptulosonate 7-phosphate (DAHP) synthase
MNTAKEFLMSTEYILSEVNPNVILCNRVSHLLKLLLVIRSI